jgi:hypothetical protein
MLLEAKEAPAQAKTPLYPQVPVVAVLACITKDATDDIPHHCTTTEAIACYTLCTARSVVAVTQGSFGLLVLTWRILVQESIPGRGSDLQ